MPDGPDGKAGVGDAVDRLSAHPYVAAL